MTPVWFEWGVNDATPDYYVTDILQVGLDSIPRDVAPEPTEDILSLLRDIYPKTGAGYASEYVTNQMHVSTIIADCDIKLRPGVQPPDLQSLADGMADVADELFGKIHQLAGVPVKHYFFHSNRDGSLNNDEKNKIGIHHHMQLPPGVVFTTTAVAQFLRILETVRFMRPRSVGLKTEDNARIYDGAIYGSGSLSAHNPKGHGLRGPWQLKKDGKRRLEPLLSSSSSSSSDIPTEAMFVHGPQIRRNGEHVVYGTVVEKLCGDLPIDDEEFSSIYKNRVLHNFMDSGRCGTDVAGIVQQLNKRTLLFRALLDSKKQRQRINSELERRERSLLVEVMRSLWRDKGVRLLLEHMRTAVGKDGVGYGNNLISLLRTTTVDFVRDRLVLTSSAIPNSKVSGSLPFCPHTPHRHTQTNTVSSFIFSDGMNSVGVQVNCFKCEHRLHKKLFMEFEDEFLAKPIRDVFLYQFLPKFERWDEVDLLEPSVEKPPPELEHVPISDRGNITPHNIVLPSSTRDVRYLYTFLPHMTNGAFLACRSATGYFVAMHAYRGDSPVNNLIIRSRSSGPWVKVLETNPLSPLYQHTDIVQKLKTIMATKEGIDV